MTEGDQDPTGGHEAADSAAVAVACEPLSSSPLRKPETSSAWLQVAGAFCLNLNTWYVELVQLIPRKAS